MKKTPRPAIFKWRQTEPELILCAARWYLRYSLSFRDVEELLSERGLKADHTTIWRWVQRYGPALEERLRRHLKPTNRSWRVDETYVRVKGRWCYLYRAIDSTGATIDFVLSELRDAATAKRTALGPSAPPTSRPSRSQRQAPLPVSIARSRAGPGRQRATPAVLSGRHGPGCSQLEPPPRPIFAPASVFAAIFGGLRGQALVGAPLPFFEWQRPVPFVDSGASCGPFPLVGDPRGSANRARRAGRSAIPVESGPGSCRACSFQSRSKARSQD